jgi:hypothetical protein
MLRASIGETALLTETWMIRPHSADCASSSPGQIDQIETTCIYDVLWYDSWVLSWMVQDASLLNEFWTERYQNRER